MLEGSGENADIANIRFLPGVGATSIFLYGENFCNRAIIVVIIYSSNGGLCCAM